MLKRILAVAGCALGLMLAAVTVQAAGSGIGDAISPVGQPRTVAAHAELWYRFELGGSKAAVIATLEANSADGLRMAIYTPEQIANWLRGDKLQAVGYAAPQREHTLGWVGQFREAGTYYAVVYNDTEAPLQVSVTVSGDNVMASAPPPTPTLRPDPLVTRTPAGKGINGKIVFADISGGTIYTVNGDGTNLQRVSFGLDPQWNHAGTQIALARQGPVAGVYVIDADGSNERLLYATNEPRSPIWSPDDSTVVFSYQGATRGGGQRCIGSRCFELPSHTEWKLGAVTLADGAFHDVRSGESAITPTWNPNGTIAYNDPSIGLFETSLTGEPAANPFLGDLRITSDSYNPLRLMSPQYSPDGKMIAYMVMQNPTWQIALANADASNQHLLTSDFALWYNHPSNVAPVWSPDSKQILFWSNRNGKWEMFVMIGDGSGVQQVLKNVTDGLELRYDFQGGKMMSWSK